MSDTIWCSKCDRYYLKRDEKCPYCELAQAQSELREAREQENIYLRQVEDVKCAMLRNPQEEFDVGIAVDEMRGQKESAEAKNASLAAQVAVMKDACFKAIKYINQLYDGNIGRIQTKHEAISSLETVLRNDIPAEAEKLLRIVEAADIFVNQKGGLLSGYRNLQKAIRDLRGDE